MPYGSYSALPLVINEIQHALRTSKTPRVLDCGIGNGIYGSIVRTYVDYGHPRNFRTFIMGIEGYAGYRQPNWEYYNYVHVMKIQDWLSMPGSQNDRFDVILLNDVLEHFEKDEGRRVLEGLISRLDWGGVLIVVTPSVHIEQGALWGNKLETHRSLWSGEDLTAMGFQLLEYSVEPNEFNHNHIVAKYMRVS